MKTKLILASMWVTGGVLCAASALLFAGVISPSDDESAKMPLAYEANVQNGSPHVSDKSVPDTVRTNPQSARPYPTATSRPDGASYALPPSVADLSAELPPPEETPTEEHGYPAEHPIP